MLCVDIYRAGCLWHICCLKEDFYEKIGSNAVYLQICKDSFMFRFQRTLRKNIHFNGVGLHTGYAVNLTLLPAPPNTGIRFRRTDLQYFEIEARRKFVAKVSYATTLMKKGVMISTVEHILSALYGLGIDNLYLDIDSMEVPIMDGSCACFTDAIQETDIDEQDEPRRYLVVEKPIEIRQGDKTAGVYPSGVPSATCIIDFTHPAIGRQQIDMELTPESFRRELARARTFGFMADVEYLQGLGLARGGSLENSVVLDSSGILNDSLRFPDEFVRHKLLDLFGDIALTGFPIIGHFHAERAGHAIHTALAEQILRKPDHCRIRTADEIEDVLDATG